MVGRCKRRSQFRLQQRFRLGADDCAAGANKAVGSRPSCRFLPIASHPSSKRRPGGKRCLHLILPPSTESSTEVCSEYRESRVKYVRGLINLCGVV